MPERSPAVVIFPWRAGHGVRVPLNEYPGFGFSRGERPPPLEELELHDYPFGREDRLEDPPEQRIWARLSAGYTEPGDEQDYWIDNFDWSRLRRLVMERPRVLPTLARKLTALEELEFTTTPFGPWETPPRYVVDHAVRFLTRMPGRLESIAIKKLMDIRGVAPLLHHAHSLRRLKICGGRSVHGHPHVLTGTELAEVRDGLPYLEELSLDMEPTKQQDWPWQLFDVLATFPRLRKLTLWFHTPVGLKANDFRPKRPWLGADAACEMFLHLHKTRRVLDSLTVHSLYPDGKKPYKLKLTPEGQMALDNSTSFVCRPAEREGDAARGLVDVTCGKLTRSQNDLLGRVVQGRVKTRTRSDRMPPATEPWMDFRVAMGGPLGMKEWTALRERDGCLVRTGTFGI